MNAPQRFPSIEALLPHRDTMLLLDRVLEFTPQALLAEYCVRRDGWYADAGQAMPAWLGIELMAQAIGAHVSLAASRAGGQARPGVLLGTSQYAAECAAFPGGARLRVAARELLSSAAGHSAYACSIGCDDALLAQATIKVFQPVDFQEFISGGLQR